MNSPLSLEPGLLEAMSEPRPFAWLGEAAGFLIRHRRTLLASVAIAVVLALFYIATATRQFTARATLLVDMPQAALSPQHEPVSDAQIQSALIESEVEVLRSAGLARQAVALLHLRDDPAFNAAPSLLSGLLRLPSWRAGRGPTDDEASDRLVQRFLDMVSAHRIGLTYVIEIDATADTPELAARLARGLTQAYLSERLAVRDASARKAADWLQTRLVQLRDKALGADLEVQRFKSQSGIVDTATGFLNEQQLAALNGELAAARARTAQASARLARIGQIATSSDGPGSAASDALRSSVINGLRERYLSDAVRVAEWSAQYGRDNRVVVSLRKDMAALQASIRSEVQRIDQSAASDLAIDRADEAAMEAQLDSLVGTWRSTNAARASLRSLQSAADSYRSLYTAMLQRAAQAVQDESFPLADARVVTQARPPLTKSSPRSKLILAAAIVLGLAAGFLAGLLREALDRRLRHPADVLAETGLPCLASLPAAVAPNGSETLADFAILHPDAPFGLGIRRLRVRLQQHGDAGRTRVIGVIAPTTGAGTSTIAASLVKCLIASGHAASLLVLSEQAGPQSRLREEIEWHRGADGFVVIDFPSLERPAEAHTLFAEIGAFALLLEPGRMGASALLDRLRSAGLERRNIIGIVLNRVPVHG